MNFPTVTICGSAQYMDRVQKALFKKFFLWKIENQIYDEEYDHEIFDQFLQKVFKTKNGTNIMNVLSTMNTLSSGGSYNHHIERTVKECSSSNVPKQRKKREDSKLL